MRRETPFAEVVRHLIPFFVARQAMCGSGRVGIGQDSRTAGYQLSQRADFFEVEVGLETTLKRPIINTRDEPHAVADLYRRLHVIIGDANHCDVANLLKFGTTSLVLAMVEDGEVGRDLTLDKPVATLHEISHDPTLRTTATLRDGRRLTAVQLLWEYHAAAADYLERRGHTAADDPDTAEVMRLWESVLTRLERDPMECAADLDWVAKLQLLQGTATATASAGATRAAGHRHPVERRPPREGTLPPAARARAGHPARRRPARRRRRDAAAGGHPGLVPRQVPGEVRPAGRRRVLGLGDLRRARPARPPAGADARAAARHQGARGRDHGPLPGRRDPPSLSWTPPPVRVEPAESSSRAHEDPREREGAMPSQEQSRPQRRDDEPADAPEPTPASPEASARKEALDDDIDSMLDEIDGVLESNAEEFVRGFVQKGGQ